MDIRAQVARDAKILKELNEEWTFTEMALDGVRGRLTRKSQTKLSWHAGIENRWQFSQGMDLATRELDLRIMRKFPTFLFQWRTSKTKGERIVLKKFTTDSSRNVDRIPIREQFLDPTRPSPDEVLFLHMLYPELEVVWQDLGEALNDMYRKLC